MEGPREMDRWWEQDKVPGRSGSVKQRLYLCAEKSLVPSPSLRISARYKPFGGTLKAKTFPVQKKKNAYYSRHGAGPTSHGT